MYNKTIKDLKKELENLEPKLYHNINIKYLYIKNKEDFLVHLTMSVRVIEYIHYSLDDIEFYIKSKTRGGTMHYLNQKYPYKSYSGYTIKGALAFITRILDRAIEIYTDEKCFEMWATYDCSCRKAT